MWASEPGAEFSFTLGCRRRGEVGHNIMKGYLAEMGSRHKFGPAFKISLLTNTVRIQISQIPDPPLMMGCFLV